MHSDRARRLASGHLTPPSLLTGNPADGDRPATLGPSPRAARLPLAAVLELGLVDQAFEIGPPHPADDLGHDDAVGIDEERLGDAADAVVEGDSTVGIGE